MVNWDSVHRTNYESKAFWDIHWIRKAKDLLKSADLIQPEVVRLWNSVEEGLDNMDREILADYYQGTYFMLRAFAVENILKAVIIRNKSTEYRRKFRDTLKFPKELQSHDLVKLAKKAGFDFTVEQEDLLRRLTRSATWHGRYPIPLNYRHSAGEERFKDGREYSVSWFGSNDVGRINDFIEELKHIFGIQC